MFINTSVIPRADANIVSRISLPKAAVVSALTIMALGAVPSQAAGLSDLFGADDKSKFLPVDKAFAVTTNPKIGATGTQMSISFDITPEHYVYKDKLTVSFPKGVSATPFTFSQKPVSINDPTFGKVPVFTQKRVVATTTLSTNNGKGASNVPVIIGWQGCAKAGLCYPPEKIKTKINIAKR